VNEIPHDPHLSTQPWVAIQRNPRSGSGRRNRELLRLVAGLKRREIRPRLYSRRIDLDAAVKDPQRRPSLIGIVAAGGDGTLLDVINRHQGVPVAVLPLGTENLFARAIGVRGCGDTLAGIIAARKHQRFDVAVCNGRRFLIVASAGFDAEVVRRAHEKRTGRINHLFYAGPILSAIRSYTFPELRVWLDDAVEPIPGRLVIVANANAYAMRLSIAPGAVGDDGWLDVCIFQKPGVARVIRDLVAVALRRHPRLTHVRMNRARKVRVEGDGSVPVQLDGDAADGTPIEITIDPAAIDIFVA